MAELQPLDQHPCVRKALYYTEDEAKQIAGFRGKASKVQLWSYFCEDCRGWHLTSMPPGVWWAREMMAEANKPEPAPAPKRKQTDNWATRPLSHDDDSRWRHPGKLPRSKPVPPPRTSRSKRQLGRALCAADAILRLWGRTVGTGSGRLKHFRKQAEAWCGCRADNNELGRIVKERKSGIPVPGEAV